MSIFEIGRKASRASTGHGHGSGCGCSSCAGLHTFVRPRFFAGQLLTDTELTALTTYMIDKDRLHNRFLHGTGVVCGLQVECDDCGPGVVVRPGYAIDPQGADIVLPGGVTVDVVDLVNACTRQQRAADCDPPRIPEAKGCEEDEQSWCLWVRYVEKQGRVVAPLGGTASGTCGCGRSSGGCSGGCSGGGSGGCSGNSSGPGGCGCGGSGAATTTSRSTRSGGCGCGGSTGSSGRSSCSCSEAGRPARRAPADCEPSRVSELYEFGVAGRDGGCCDESLADRLQGTFPVKVVECITSLRPLLSRGLTKNMQTSALSLALGAQVSASNDSARTAICTLYQNVVELYRRDPLHTECILPTELFEIDCSPYDREKETLEEYRQRLFAALEALIILVLLYLRDCICFSLLPPCPPDTCDDRVMLACVTVRDGKVVRICNLSCRRYAGSFVTREYWMPIGPVLSWLAALVCCFPIPTRRFVRMPDDDGDLQNSRMSLKSNLIGPLNSGAFDTILSTLRADNFALAGLWRDRARTAVRRVQPLRRLMDVEDRLREEKGTTSLAPLLHTDLAKARASLRRKGIKVEVVEVQDRAEALGRDLVPRAAKGDTATLYTLGGTIVGVSGARSTVGTPGGGS